MTDPKDAERLAEAREILGDRNNGCWVYDNHGREYCDERLAKTLALRDATIISLARERDNWKQLYYDARRRLADQEPP